MTWCPTLGGLCEQGCTDTCALSSREVGPEAPEPSIRRSASVEDDPGPQNNWHGAGPCDDRDDGPAKGPVLYSLFFASPSNCAEGIGEAAVYHGTFSTAALARQYALASMEKDHTAEFDEIANGTNSDEDFAELDERMPRPNPDEEWGQWDFDDGWWMVIEAPLDQPIGGGRLL